MALDTLLDRALESYLVTFDQTENPDYSYVCHLKERHTPEGQIQRGATGLGATADAALQKALNRVISQEERGVRMRSLGE